MTEPRVHTVSELAGYIKQCLEDNFFDRTVEGEVSEFKVAAAGHWYFSIKDEGAVLKCAIWRSNVGRTSAPKIGEKVRLFGSISGYAPNGTYSFVATRLDRTGAGDLAARLEALRKKLAAEGLFDPDKKRELPKFPRAVGIATAAGSAALADMRRIVHERFPVLIVHAPCKVQGEGAAEDVVRALARLNAHPLVDVIIVGRGGGSAEDLWAFNEEVLVRAVGTSAKPIVSAVGHESDQSLCDLAADVRAPTPSHAAAAVVPQIADVIYFLDERHERLTQALQRRVERARERVNALRLVHPRERLQRVRSNVSDLNLRLASSTSRTVVAARARLTQIDKGLLPAARRSVIMRADRLARLQAAIEALAPQRVLDRGYAIVIRQGVALRSVGAARPGDAVAIRLGDGQLTATITGAPDADR